MHAYIYAWMPVWTYLRMDACNHVLPYSIKEWVLHLMLWHLLLCNVHQRPSLINVGPIVSSLMCVCVCVNAAARVGAPLIYYKPGESPFMQHCRLRAQHNFFPLNLEVLSLLTRVATNGRHKKKFSEGYKEWRISFVITQEWHWIWQNVRKKKEKEGCEGQETPPCMLVGEAWQAQFSDHFSFGSRPPLSCYFPFLSRPFFRNLCFWEFFLPSCLLRPWSFSVTWIFKRVTSETKT